MSDFITLGELLIDFTPSGQADGRNLFMQNAGGAVANAAAAVAAQGLDVSFLGMVGDDQFGHFLRDTLREKNIDTSGVILSEEYNTTLAFVHLFENGERDFSFYRKPGADIMYSAADIDKSKIKSAKVFHFGAVSMTDEPSRSATYAGAEFAIENGLVVSFDPNYRAPLWDSETEAIEHIKNGLALCDIVKIADNEVELLYGDIPHEHAAQNLLDMGISQVYITLGNKGACFANKEGFGFAEGFKANAIDATGAGDCFTGSVVSQFIKSGKTLPDYTLQDMEHSAVFANAAASICVEGKGGIPSMPKVEQIMQRLNKK
ncbi:MAG: carbohydrate kinase [Clostridia bacterium]|jgi:fructokinase|nr:carbohydrate kinase [Clostridia bacterium]MBT7121602.1 carbohydrate kinase [Clostridia bacterium]